MKRSNADIVMEAIQDLHNLEQIVTRETLAELTGLKLTVIDDRLSHLIDNGAIKRVQRGVFEPMPVHPPARLITKTMLPDGTVKIEIGDDIVITLTPRESRMLGELQSGAAHQFTAVEQGHQAATVNAELWLQLKQVKRELAGLKNAMTGNDSRQLGLLAGDAH